MKRIPMGVLFFTLSTTAMAGGVSIDAKLPGGARPADVRFEADESLGTAWAEVRFVVDDPVGDSGVRVEETKVLVPGLSYDRAAHAVRLDGPGGSVVCATRQRILFSTTYPETPTCRLHLGDARTPDAERVFVDVAGPERTAANARHNP